MLLDSKGVKMRKNGRNSPGIWIVSLAFCLLMPVWATAQTIVIESLTTAPLVDGVDDDWRHVPPQTIAVTGPLAVSSVRAKGGIHGKRVFFLFQWADAQADILHKPFVWNEAAGRYRGGPQREDRFAIQFAIQFAISGDYDVDWFSGRRFTADMWHWKASRSNPIGLAHDKRTIVGLEPVKRAFKQPLADGRQVYVQRPGDAGGKLYRTKRYRRRSEEVMPKYVLDPSVSGSVADVTAKGVWKDGFWTLELARDLDTGHADDVVFSAGQTVPGGIAVFDRSGDDEHNISETLHFQF